MSYFDPHIGGKTRKFPLSQWFSTGRASVSIIQQLMKQLSVCLFCSHSLRIVGVAVQNFFIFISSLWRRQDVGLSATLLLVHQSAPSLICSRSWKPPAGQRPGRCSPHRTPLLIRHRSVTNKLSSLTWNLTHQVRVSQEDSRLHCIVHRGKSTIHSTHIIVW